jgi:hypothetical protein
MIRDRGAIFGLGGTQSKKMKLKSETSQNPGNASNSLFSVKKFLKDA